MIPSMIVIPIWLVVVSIYDLWYLFEEKWVMSLTMIVGAFVAGSSPLGGGAVAFPVMSLILKLAPTVSKNFSLMIQSIGMTGATFYIFYKKKKIHETIILYSILGCTFGFMVGYYLLLEYPSPKTILTIFFSLCFAFGILFMYHNHKMKNEKMDDEEMDDEKTYDKVSVTESKTDIESQEVKKLEIKNLDKVLIVLVSFFGGIISSFIGNGVDIFIFLFIVFYYKETSIFATNISIIMMTYMSLFGFYNVGIVDKNISLETYEYWVVSIPIVIIFAPLGSIVINNVKEIYINGLLYFLLLAQYLAGFVIIISKSWKLVLLSVSFVVIALSIIVVDYLRNKEKCCFKN